MSDYVPVIYDFARPCDDNHVAECSPLRVRDGLHGAIDPALLSSRVPI